MDRLKELRNSRKLTQKQIAELLGVDRTTYVKYETHNSDPPTETLVSLAAFYGVTIGYLMGVEDDPAQPAASFSAAPENDPSLDPLRQHAIELFDAIPEDRKDAALDYLRFLAAQKKS